MQEAIDETRAVLLKLTSCAEEVNVAGFADRYSAYHKQEAKVHRFQARLVSWLGIALLLVGGATIIFGPETIYYSIASGPTLFQYVQIYPGYIATAGGILLSVGAKMRLRLIMPPEQYLKLMRIFIATDGRDVTEQVQVKYIDGDKFFVELKEVAAP